MTQTPSFVTTCTEDEDGNVILDFPEELLETMGWGEGTVLDITALPGRIMLRKIEPSSESEVDSAVGGEGNTERGDSPA
jgi:bifunctional DNA-binding transcriptional regulator/antitoxin component of YhaV-PrlF toxin-antitoxin module